MVKGPIAIGNNYSSNSLTFLLLKLLILLKYCQTLYIENTITYIALTAIQ